MTLPSCTLKLRQVDDMLLLSGRPRHINVEILCRGRQALAAAMATVMALCVVVTVGMVAQPTALLATDMTLGTGLSRAGKVHSDNPLLL